MDIKRAALVAGLFLAALIGGGLFTRDDEPRPRYQTSPDRSTIADLAKRQPDRVDMRELVRLSKTIAPALKRGAQCETLDCTKRALTSACETLAKMDDMAYDLEERIGQAASLAISDASTSCAMALHYIGKGEAATATVMVREMDSSLARATRTLGGR